MTYSLAQILACVPPPLKVFGRRDYWPCKAGDVTLAAMWCNTVRIIIAMMGVCVASVCLHSKRFACKKSINKTTYSDLGMMVCLCSEVRLVPGMKWKHDILVTVIALCYCAVTCTCQGTEWLGMASTVSTKRQIAGLSWRLGGRAYC